MSESDENTADDTAEEAQEVEEKPEAPETTVERTGPCECVIRIAASAEYLRYRYQEDLASLQQEIKLPGFRHGKAPIGLVESRMGGSLKSDLIASVMGEAYDEAVDENDLSVVAEVDAPDLESMSWQPGQPAEFEFRCEVMPELELDEAQYKGLKIEPPALEPTDEMLQAEKDRFAQQFATWEEVKGAGIDWDDYVEATVAVPDADWSDTIVFFPRAERIGPLAIEGMKGLVSGATVGDELEAEAEVTEGEGATPEPLQPLVGQKVKVRIAIERATRRKVPDLDDELAKKIGMSSVEELDSLVSERLGAALTRRKDEIARDLAVNLVLDKASFELPASLVDRASEEEQTRMLVRLLRQGVQREEAEQQAAEGVVQGRDVIERRLKASFLLRKLAEKERILVTEAEVDAQVRAFASRQGWREERAKAYMEKRGMLRALREDMREGKATDFLLENAEVHEIPPEEFRKRHGGERAEDKSDDE
jgi:trigger factor